MPDPIDISTRPVPVKDQPHQDGHKIWPTALNIDPGEKGFLLVERNEQSLGSRGFHRYQTIFVNRGDKLAKWMGDMGTEVAFKVQPFSIPSGDLALPATEWAHTIDELQEFAIEMRAHLLEKMITRGDLLAPDLVQMYADEIEQREWVKKGKRIYGPLVPTVHWSKR